MLLVSYGIVGVQVYCGQVCQDRCIEVNEGAGKFMEVGFGTYCSAAFRFRL